MFNYAPKIVTSLRERDLLPGVFLLDVGASGGIPLHYRAFEDRLSAVGFDPSVPEVRRLNEIEINPQVKYESAWIVCENYDELFPPGTWDPVVSKNNNPWSRLSAVRAFLAMQNNAAKDGSEAAPAVELSASRYSLDTYVDGHDIAMVDVIKIDTDGHDFEVLLGAEQTIKTRGVIAIEIEVQLHGPLHPYSNVFHNIDRFMREQGLSLFDCEIRKYSRGALPGPFVYQIPAQTTYGQVLWADALYLRDLGDPNYSTMHQFPVNRDSYLKLCCLFDIFGIPDCAAETIITARDMNLLGDPLAALLLDQLAPEGESYEDYLARFDADPTAFYPNIR